MSTTALDKDTSFKADVNKILEDKTLSEQDKANAINQMVGSLYAGSSSKAYEAYLGRKPTSDEVLAFNAFLAKGGVGVVGGATPPALKGAVDFLNKNTGLGESDIASLAKAVGLSYNPTTDILFDPTSNQLTKVDTSKLGTTFYGADNPLTNEVENFQPGTPEYVQAFINRLAKDNPTLTAEDFKNFATKGYGLPDTAFTADPTKNTLGTLNIDKNMYLIPTSATTGATTNAGGNKIGGSGVDFSGESGLREFYGPYVQDFLSRMSAYLARYDQPKIKTENGQTFMGYYNPETKAQEWKPVKYEEKDGYTYIDGQALPRRPEFGVTYGQDTAKSLKDIQDELKRRTGLGTGTPTSAMYTPYQYTAAGIQPTGKASGGIASLARGGKVNFDDGGYLDAGGGSQFDQNRATTQATLTNAQNLVNTAREQFGEGSPQYQSASNNLLSAQKDYSYFTNPANNPANAGTGATGTGATGNTTYTPTAGATGATSTFTAPTAGFTSTTYGSGYVAPTAYNAGTISSTYTAPEEYTASNIASDFTKPADYVASNIASTYASPEDIYKASTISSTFTKPKDYVGNTISSTYTKPTDYTTSDFATELFGADQAAKYMSPYTSGVVDPQLREAKRQADLARLVQNAKFAQSGAFGGARNAIAEAELGRNLATQLGDIYGKGQQEAFLNAQQQFERDQQRRIAAEQIKEQSKQFGYGQKTRAEEIAAQLGLEASKATEQSKQFGADFGLRGETTAAQLAMEAAKATEQAKQVAGQQALLDAQKKAELAMEAAKANELSKQFGFGQKLAAETTAAQLGLDAAKANELSKQFGYGQKASAARTAAELGLEAAKATEQAKQEAGRQGLTAAEAAARLGLDASRLTESSKQFGATYGLDVARTEADYKQRAADLKQRAQEAYDTGNYRAAQLALDNLRELNRSQEATRTFDYTETRDTQLDPLRELSVAASLLSGLPTSAGGQDTSSITNALLALLGSNNLLFPTK